MEIDTHSLMYQGLFIEFDYTDLTVNWSKDRVEGVDEQIIDHIVHSQGKDDKLSGYLSSFMERIITVLKHYIHILFHKLYAYSHLIC